MAACPQRCFRAHVAQPDWNRCRVDHAFVTPCVLARVRACQYAHQERDDVTTDHSIMVVEIGVWKNSAELNL
jgi:hypothetical protein